MKVTTLQRNFFDTQKLHPSASGVFTNLLTQITLAAKLISYQVNQAGLLDDILGSTGEVNVQGEEVQKLDEFAISSDTIEEINENKEQIEISKFYERLPNPAIIATEEFLNKEIYHRYNDKKRKG